MVRTTYHMVCRRYLGTTTRHDDFHRAACRYGVGESAVLPVNPEPHIEIQRGVTHGRKGLEGQMHITGMPFARKRRLAHCSMLRRHMHRRVMLLLSGTRGQEERKLNESRRPVVARTKKPPDVVVVEEKKRL